MFVLLCFYIEELFWWNCTTNSLIMSFFIFLKHFILKIIYKPFFPKFQLIFFILLTTQALQKYVENACLYT